MCPKEPKKAFWGLSLFAFHLLTLPCQQASAQKGLQMHGHFSARPHPTDGLQLELEWDSVSSPWLLVAQIGRAAQHLRLDGSAATAPPLLPERRSFEVQDKRL